MLKRFVIVSVLVTVAAGFGIGYAKLEGQSNVSDNVQVICAPCSGRPWGIQADNGMVALVGDQLNFYSLSVGDAQVRGFGPDALSTTKAQPLGRLTRGGFVWLSR